MSIRLCIDNTTPGHAGKTLSAAFPTGPAGRLAPLSAIGLRPDPHSLDSLSCFPSFPPPRAQLHAALAGVCRLGGASPDGLTQTVLHCFGGLLSPFDFLPVPGRTGNCPRRDRHGRLHRAIA
jgi:hypothetical protein